MDFARKQPRSREEGREGNQKQNRISFLLRVCLRVLRAFAIGLIGGIKVFERVVNVAPSRYIEWMPVTLGIRNRRQLEKWGIGMPGDNRHILDVARRLRDVVDAPVLGGIAVYLHGVRRFTADLDLYTPDRKATAVQLEAAGAVWNKVRKEHILDGVRIHTVTPEDAQVTVEQTSVIDGVRVVRLKDLVAIKLYCGLENPGRSKDISDVEELIRSVPLDKRFAPKLPKEIRSEFKALVDAVRAGDRLRGDRRF